MADLFEDLPLDSRVEVIYERKVGVEPIADSVDCMDVPQPAIGALSGWYAILDAERDLVCLVPPGGICENAHADNVARARANVVAAMLNQQAPSWPPDAGDLQLVTPRARERGHADLHRGAWHIAMSLSGIGGAGPAKLNGRSFHSVTMMCTFEDLQDAGLMTRLRDDVASHLAPGGKLTIRVV